MIAPADPSNTRSNLLILNRIISYRSAHTASCCSSSVLISAVVIRFLLILPQHRFCLVFYDWRFFIKRWFLNDHTFTYIFITSQKPTIRHHNKRCSFDLFSNHLNLECSLLQHLYQLLYQLHLVYKLVLLELLHL